MGGQVNAIDDKGLRRSHDKGIGKAAIDIISAWALANRLVLGQVKVDEKSNEIAVIDGINIQQKVILAFRRVEIDELENWCRKNLPPTDEVVLEATTNAWATYALAAPLVQRCVIASPSATI